MRWLSAKVDKAPKNHILLSLIELLHPRGLAIQ
jgi:hypothetical protein